MEEQNKNNNESAQVVGMENKQDAPTVPNEATSPKTVDVAQLSREEINDICVKLSKENQYLKQTLLQAEKMLESYDRLAYLFRVVELSQTEGKFAFSEDFVAKCIRTIERIMVLPDDEPEKESVEEKEQEA